MANIPENTTDPILRPVTRLETTTKVFGGAYIPDDEQQRGISNLQAIELAERDQYILSRVGEAEVEPSGDIPGDVGIASLDTSGKLPKAENTTGVVFTDDIQTLENKSIDKNANTVTCSPYEINTSQTLTPTKELNVVITDSVTLTLGNGPYAGYSLPITAQADSSVVFTGPGGSTTNNLLANQKITYTWRGSFWDSDAALAPVYIHASTTVSPSADINYVVDTASVVLTISDGVYSGQEVSVTAEAACSVTYKGINGTTTAPLAAYNRNELVWNGSYWLSTIGAVIEGRTASGSNFTYGGGIDVAVVPDSTETITEDGATLDPSTVSKFILNIDTEGATCSIDDGVTVGQIITLVNANENIVAVSYADFGGDTKTDNILGGNNESYIWSGTHWSSGVVTPDSVTTFGNKTIDSSDNTIKNTPIDIGVDTTLSAVAGETNIAITSEYVCITLPNSGPYAGCKINVNIQGHYCYVKPADSSWCVCPVQQVSSFVWTGSIWVPMPGSTFAVSSAVVTNKPAGVSVVGDWRVYLGCQGVYYYSFAYSDTGDIYNIPNSNCEITVSWRGSSQAVATAVLSYYTTPVVKYWTINRSAGTWNPKWTYLVGTSGGTGTTHSVTTFSSTGISGNLYWLVQNGTCYVQINSLTFTSAGTGKVICPLPGNKLGVHIPLMTGSNALVVGNLYIGSGILYVHLLNSGVNVSTYASFSYPVADSYVES